MKKQLLLILMVLLPIAVSAYDIEVKNADGVTIYYKYINDGSELEVTLNPFYEQSYFNDVAIPEEVTYMNRTRRVTSIGERAFYNCTSLTSVTIPNSVTFIGESAFYNCTSLTLVTIPNSVTSIGDEAFSGCSSLTSVIIPDSVTIIGYSAFRDCSGLPSVTIPNSVIYIGSRAFSGCTALESVSIGNSVRLIDGSAFSGCTSLSSISIGDSVTYIGGWAFEGCTSLKSIEMPNSVTRIGKYAFFNCSGLNSIIMHNSIEIIDNYAFRGCTSLTSISIPSSVKYLGGSVFYDCIGLKDITIPNSVIYIGSNPFEGTTWYNNLPDGMIYKDNVFLGVKGDKPKNDITIKEGTRLIAGHALHDCELITSVSIPNSVISIGSFAFYGCRKIKAIDIPKSVKSIGEHAFYFCTSLGTFTIPDSINSIGVNAFKSTKWFYDLPDGIIYKDNAILGYIGSSPQGELNIAEGTRIIAGSAFDRLRELTSVKIPNSLEYIGEEAFYGCKELTSVKFGNSVKSIGLNAFYNCDQLKSITLPSSLIYIDYQAFNFCTGLEEIHCMNQHPNAFDYSVLDYEKYSTATLYVPVGSKEKYQSTEGWKFFKNILYNGEVKITAKNYTREYGEANPTFGYDICEGKIESGQPLLTCSATETSPVGTYDIVIERGTLTNDIITSVSGTLTITKAPLTISAGNYTKKVGEDNPIFTPIYTGLKNNETDNVLSQQAVITCSATSDSPVGIYTVSVSNAEAQNYNISHKNGILKIKDNEDCSINGHEYVDLGLPSGRVWATMNYGASSEEEYGSYLNWSSRSNIKNTWGEEWTTPTQSDINELINYCDFSWMFVGNSIYGFKVTGKNGKSIFLPATGYYISGTYQLVNQRVCYWSDTMANTDFAFALDGHDTNISSTNSYNYLYVSLPIRPVANKKTTPVVSEFIYNGIKYTVVSQTDQTVEVAASNQSAGSDGPISYSGDIVIPSTVSYGDKTYTVIGIGQSAFVNCVGITSVSLPNTLTYIRKEAFNLCVGLKSITIPESVTSYGYDVFSMTSISEITVLNPVPVEVPYNAFYYPQSNNNCVLYVPYGTSNAYKNAAEWKKFKTIIEMNKQPDTLNGHEYIDLGLPSGKCWATMNYGANSQDDYGSYVYWTERNTISSEWGSGWTTPSLQDIRELENNCTWTWDSKNGHSGYTITGKNGKSIFLPASGFLMYGQSSAKKVDEWAYYWTSDMSDEMAYVIMSSSSNVSYGQMEYSYTKLPIRLITKDPMTDGISNRIDKAVLIQSNGGVLTIQGADEGTQVSVYSINGTEAGKAIIRNGCATVNTNLQTGSVAIVKVGEKSVKVVIK